MIYDGGIMSYFLHAHVVVQGVMLVLMIASVWSWATILRGILFVKELAQATDAFEREFWSGEELTALYARVDARQHITQQRGLAGVFHAGFEEFMRFRKQPTAAVAYVVTNTERAMRVATIRMQDHLEAPLPMLAIIGSTSPYIGLFGTVWGIMQSFSVMAGPSTTGQASIAAVAPGIAEALVATALGLFAAIPAVVAYNRLLAATRRLLNRCHLFQEELVNILTRHLQEDTVKPIAGEVEER